MSDDFNTPRAISQLFDLVTKINSLNEGHLDVNQLSAPVLDRLKKDFPIYISDILGLKIETEQSDNGALDKVMELVLDLRQNARTEKNWIVADKIRDKLSEANIIVKDGKDGTNWTLN